MNKSIMRQLGFNEEVDAVERGLCPFCSQPVRLEDFRDELSVKESAISGLCQSCQNKTFGGEE